MTHVFIGCNQITGKRHVYFQRLSALEVHETFDDRITARRLSQWRTSSPKGFTFSMRAHKALTHPYGPEEALPGFLGEQPRAKVGLLQDSEAVRLAWAETLRLEEALSPRVILLETPMALTPSTENRARVEWFARELAPQAKAAVAWKPHGLWDLEETIPWVRDLGLVPVFDPTAEELKLPPARGTGYFVLHDHRGTRSNWTEFDMEALLESLQPYQRAFLFFRGGNRYRDARLAFNAWKTLEQAGVL